MAKFSLYASSPDGLAQQQQNYERVFAGAAEGNRAANMDAQRFNIQAMIQAQQADEAARVHDAQNQMQAFRVQSADAENRRRFDLGQSQAETERMKAEAFQNNFVIPQAQQTLEANKFKLDEFKNRPAKEADAMLDSMIAYSIDPKSQFISDAKTFGEAFKQKEDVARPVWEQMRARHVARQAALLNQQVNSRLASIAESQIKVNPEWVADEATKNTVRRQVEAELPTGLHKSVKLNRDGFYQAVGDVAAAIPEDAEVAAGNWAWNAQPQTTTALPMGSSFGAPVVAPPQFSMPAMQSQYIPGRRYGNLRYRGGDPNSEASWTPAN